MKINSDNSLRLLSINIKAKFLQSNDYAATLKDSIDACASASNSATELVNLLMSIFIGNGFINGRGVGPYFIGNFNGALGFRADLRDSYNQVQHAVAGILLAHKGWPYIYFARSLEAEPQDIRLYDAMTPIGKSLSDSNFKRLGMTVLHALRDFNARQDMLRNMA